MKKQVMMICVCLASVAASAAVVDFEAFVLASDSYYPAITSGAMGFSSQGVSFPYFGNVAWNSWDGFVYSNKTDNKTPGFGNQYSAITGKGVGNSNNYVVAYPGYSTGYITVPTNSIVQSAYFTNTTYAFWVMKQGDSVFGLEAFDASDYLKLTITGYNADDQQTGNVEVDLATGSNILSEWLLVDLSGLGLVSKLGFSFDGSDTLVYDGVTYLNTPTYFAMDNLTVAYAVLPEPATLLMMGLGGILLTRKYRP